MTTTKTNVKHYDHACTNCFTDQGPCTGECAIGTEATDKLTTLITGVAKVLDGAMAVPADADREQATLSLAYDLISQIRAVLPGAFKPVPDDLWIAGFTLGFCDDGSAFLQADNRPGEEGVSVRIDHLSKALSDLYVAASQKPADDFDAALSALDIPDDIATKVVDREVSFEADNDCGDACKI